MAASLKSNRTNILLLGGGGAGGDVVGPTSATANALVVFDGMTGKLVKQGAGNITLESLATTPTTGLGLLNGTAATSGATVQMSPRLQLRGNAWDTSASQTVDFFVENLPASAATPTGMLKFGYSLNGGAVSYPMTLASTGRLTVGDIVLSSTVQVGTNIYFTSAGRIYSPANAVFALRNTAGTDGVRLDAATADTLKVRNNAGTADGALSALSLTTGGAAWIFGAASAGAPTADSKIRVTIGGVAYDISAQAV